MLAQTSVVVSHRLTGRAASSSDSAKSPPFHSAGRSRACGMTPGSQSSVAMLSFHMGFIQREDMRARHGVPGIVPLRASQSSLEQCPFFNWRNLISAFPVSLPYLLQEDVNSQKQMAAPSPKHSSADPERTQQPSAGTATQS